MILENDHDSFGHPMARRQPVDVPPRSILQVNEFQALVDNAASLSSTSSIEDPAGPLSRKSMRRKASKGNAALSKKLRLTY